MLARLTGADVLPVHVANGHFNDLELRESEKTREDRACLERLCSEIGGKGMVCAGRLATGDPATELMRVAAEEGVQDLLHGGTADRVRHGVSIPVLMVRAK